MSETAERAHAATSHRRHQALQQGHVARSHELISASLTLCGLLTLALLGAGLVGSCMAMLREQLGGEAWLTVCSGDVASHLTGLGLRLAQTFLPVLAVLMVIAGLLNLMQSRFVLFPQRAWIDPQRLHPSQGWSRMLSLDSIVPALLGLVKLLSVGALTAWYIVDQHEALLSAAAGEFAELGPKLARVVLEGALRMGGLLLVLGGVDYAYRWWRHELALRMTTEEVRNEQHAVQRNSRTVRQHGGRRGAPAETVPSISQSNP